MATCMDNNAFGRQRSDRSIFYFLSGKWRVIYVIIIYIICISIHSRTYMNEIDFNKIRALRLRIVRGIRAEKDANRNIRHRQSISALCMMNRIEPHSHCEQFYIMIIIVINIIIICISCISFEHKFGCQSSV